MASVSMHGPHSMQIGIMQIGTWNTYFKRTCDCCANDTSNTPGNKVSPRSLRLSLHLLSQLLGRRGQVRRQRSVCQSPVHSDPLRLVFAVVSVHKNAPWHPGAAPRPQCRDRTTSAPSWRPIPILSRDSCIRAALTLCTALSPRFRVKPRTKRGLRVVGYGPRLHKVPESCRSLKCLLYRSSEPKVDIRFVCGILVESWGPSIALCKQHGWGRRVSSFLPLGDTFKPCLGMRVCCESCVV